MEDLKDAKYQLKAFLLRTIYSVKRKTAGLLNTLGDLLNSSYQAPANRLFYKKRFKPFQSETID